MSRKYAMGLVSLQFIGLNALGSVNAFDTLGPDNTYGQGVWFGYYEGWRDLRSAVHADGERVAGGNLRLDRTRPVYAGSVLHVAAADRCEQHPRETALW